LPIARANVDDLDGRLGWATMGSLVSDMKSAKKIITFSLPGYADFIGLALIAHIQEHSRRIARGEKAAWTSRYPFRSGTGYQQQRWKAISIQHHGLRIVFYDLQASMQSG
jgi:hypothetical protein